MNQFPMQLMQYECVPSPSLGIGSDTGGCHHNLYAFAGAVALGSVAYTASAAGFRPLGLEPWSALLGGALIGAFAGLVAAKSVDPACS